MTVAYIGSEPFWTGLDATKNPKGSLGSAAGYKNWKDNLKYPRKQHCFTDLHKDSNEILRGVTKAHVS